MNILYLGLNDSPLINFLKKDNNNVMHWAADRKLEHETILEFKPDWIVSFGYRQIIRKDFLNLFKDRVINLHISYLPWNRGSDPNFWSFIENSPKGVTIHFIDEGVDTGAIIAQKEIDFNTEEETLASSYNKLQSEIQTLFYETWPSIKNESFQAKMQVEGEGSFHFSKQKQALDPEILPNSWNTKIKTMLENYERIYNKN